MTELLEHVAETVLEQRDRARRIVQQAAVTGIEPPELNDAIADLTQNQFMNRLAEAVLDDTKTNAERIVANGQLGEVVRSGLERAIDPAEES